MAGDHRLPCRVAKKLYSNVRHFVNRLQLLIDVLFCKPPHAVQSLETKDFFFFFKNKTISINIG